MCRPPDLVVGVGARRGVSADELDSLIDAALAEGGLAAAAVRALATGDIKAQEPGIRAVAARRGWTLVTFTAAELAAEPIPHPSEVVRAVTGSSSVAEAAACRAARCAGGAADIVVPKRSGVASTVAVARIVAPRCGVPRSPVPDRVLHVDQGVHDGAPGQGSGHSCTGTLSCIGGR